MAKSTILFTFEVRRYEEPMWGFRRMGRDRYWLNLGYISLTFELWWKRGGLSSV